MEVQSDPLFARVEKFSRCLTWNTPHGQIVCRVTGIKIRVALQTIYPCRENLKSSMLKTSKISLHAQIGGYTQLRTFFIRKFAKNGRSLPPLKYRMVSNFKTLTKHRRALARTFEVFTSFLKKPKLLPLSKKRNRSQRPFDTLQYIAREHHLHPQNNTTLTSQATKANVSRSKKLTSC